MLQIDFPARQNIKNQMMESRLGNSIDHPQLNQRNGRTLRIRVDSSFWLDRTQSLRQWIKDSIGYLSIFLEPIIDPMSLIDLSIALLVTERVVASLQSYETKFLTDNLILKNYQQSGGTDEGASWNIGVVFESPVVGLLGILALSSCILKSSHRLDSTLTPLWERMPPSQSSAILLYLLLALFCFECGLVISIFLLACHALTFPEYATGEYITTLLFLSVAWLISLIGSHFLRYNLYQSLGD